jgi:hypothetical protein
MSQKGAASNHNAAGTHIYETPNRLYGRDSEFADHDKLTNTMHATALEQRKNTPDVDWYS